MSLSFSKIFDLYVNYESAKEFPLRHLQAETTAEFACNLTTFLIVAQGVKDATLAVYCETAKKEGL
jgi:hypothetical protein